VSYTVPGCYTTDGQPVVVADRSVVIVPPFEGKAQPTPAQAAASVAKAIAALTPQPSIL